MPKAKLTDPFIRNEVASIRCEYYDTIETGLILRISNTGVKTFAYRYRDLIGNKVRMTIGRYPDKTLAEARTIVKEYKHAILKGNYPRTDIEQKKQEVVDAVTFAMLAERFRASKIKTLRPETMRIYEWIIQKKLLPVLGKRNIKQIQKKDILTIINKLSDTEGKPTLANRVLAVASGMFTYALEQELIESHPVKGIKKFKHGENKIDTVFSDIEIRAIWQAVESQGDPVRTCIKFMFATGQRKTETTSVRWDQIDFKKRIWVIPKEVTKNKTEHHVPLSSLAIDLLKEIEPLTGSSEYVFNSPRINRENKYTSIKLGSPAQYRIIKTSGVPGFNFHNIRRTFTTKLAGDGVDRTVLGKLLNHKEVSKDNLITAIYDRHAYLDKMRIAVENWGVELMRIVKGEENEAKITRIGAL